MTVGRARSIARRWVHDHAREVPGLQGVIYGGSVNAWPDSAEYDPLSDIDLWHLVSGDTGLTVRQRKLIYEGALLEPAYLRYEAFKDAETVLGSWALAYAMSVPSIIHDPTGRLRSVQEAVSREYRKPQRIRQRCDAIVAELRDGWIPRLAAEASLTDRVFALLYSVTTLQQLPLVASLQFPTIRKSTMLFTQTLASLGRDELSGKRLLLLGSSATSRDAVEELLDSCVVAYDRALEVHREATPYDYDLSVEARPFAIGGSRDLIDRGYHREAVPWISFMHLVAYLALEKDAPEECARRFRPAFERLARTLGIDSISASEARARLVAEVLSETRDLAGSMIEG